MNKDDGFWSEWRIRQLQELWADHAIRTLEIGRRLNCTKNAVIGKANRLDLPPRAPRRIDFMPKPQPAWIDQMLSGGCAYDLAGKGEVFNFCGAETKPGSDYCAEHHAICHAKPTAREKAMLEVAA